MKRLITRIRTADKRRRAAALGLAVVFGGLNWGFAKLIGLLIDNNPNDYSVSAAATSGYLIGSVVSYAVVDLVRWSYRTVDNRLGRKAQAATK